MACIKCFLQGHKFWILRFIMINQMSQIWCIVGFNEGNVDALWDTFCPFPILTFCNMLRHQRLALRGQISNFRGNIEFLILDVYNGPTNHANRWSSVRLSHCIIDLSRWFQLIGLAQTMYESFWKAVERLTRFTECICKHCNSVAGDSHLSTFSQDAMCQMALFGSAEWWRYVMWNARIPQCIKSVIFFYSW